LRTKPKVSTQYTFISFQILYTMMRMLRSYSSWTTGA